MKGTEVGLRGTLQIRKPSFYHLQGFAARKRRVEPPSRNSTHREPFPEDWPPACRAECKQEGARVADTQEKVVYFALGLHVPCRYCTAAPWPCNRTSGVLGVLDAPGMCGTV